MIRAYEMTALFERIARSENDTLKVATALNVFVRKTRVEPRAGLALMSDREWLVEELFVLVRAEAGLGQN